MFLEFKRHFGVIHLLSLLIIKHLESDLTQYMTYIYELFQSAYKGNHNTETALVKVQNDVLRALDGQQSVILLHY